LINDDSVDVATNLKAPEPISCEASISSPAPRSAATYGSGGNFFTDSGVANAYVLSPIGSRIAPDVYSDGQSARFRAGNAPTGASTINVGGVGVVDFVNNDGSAFTGGEFGAGDEIEASHDIGSGAFKLVATSTLSSLIKTIQQTTHGFIVNDILRLSGGAYVKALADTIPNAQSVGIVVAVIDVNNFVIQFSGYATGLSGLTIDTLHFLDASTPGAFTTTEPEVSKPVIFADSTTSGWILPQIPIGLSVSIATGAPDAVSIPFDDGGVIKKLKIQSGTINTPGTDQTIQVTLPSAFTGGFISVATGGGSGGFGTDGSAGVFTWLNGASLTNFNLGTGFGGHGTSAWIAIGFDT